jgi:hypothetical protein
MQGKQRRWRPLGPAQGKPFATQGKRVARGAWREGHGEGAPSPGYRVSDSSDLTWRAAAQVWE